MTTSHICGPRRTTRRRSDTAPRLAVTAPRRTGQRVEDGVLAHNWPSHHVNVNFDGTHSVDIDGEVAELVADGNRPLRPPGGQS